VGSSHLRLLVKYEHWPLRLDARHIRDEGRQCRTLGNREVSRKAGKAIRPQSERWPGVSAGDKGAARFQRAAQHPDLGARFINEKYKDVRESEGVVRLVFDSSQIRYTKKPAKPKKGRR